MDQFGKINCPCIDCIVYSICKQKYHKITYILLDDQHNSRTEIVDRPRNLFELTNECKMLREYVATILVNNEENKLKSLYTSIVLHIANLHHIFEGP